MQNQQNNYFKLINKLFPPKTICIITTYSTSKIEEKLKAITFPYSKDRKLFKGSINFNSFLLYSEFDYSPRSLLRPEIIGEIKSKKTKSEVNICFKLSLMTKSMAKLGILFNILVFITFMIIAIIGFFNFDSFKITFDLPKEFLKFHFLLIPFIHAFMLYLGYKATVFAINTKTDSSIAVFKKLLTPYVSGAPANKRKPNKAH